MKIGILTFHRSRNYGAVLQAYCLVKKLESLGHQAEIIDYSCSKIEEGLKLWNKSNSLIYSIKQFLFRLHKKRMFDKFIRKKLSISKEKNIDSQNIKSVCNNYDCVIVGSDQVWNQYITNNDDTFFMHDLDNKVKKIAYSASGGDRFEITYDNINCLKSYAKISVRENMLKEYLSKYDISSSICCDPTLLVDTSDLLSKRLKEKKYIFLYMLWDCPHLRKLANSYAKKNNCVVISNKDCIDFFLNCEVGDYLSWIKNSEGVITNSFHATVFSLKFHKPLLANCEKKTGEKNSRIYELLTDVHCTQCEIDNQFNQEFSFPSIDYNYVDKVINEKSNRSTEWLRKSLL